MTAESLVVDAPETAPVITLKLENGSVQPFLYNKDILVTPIAWRLQNDNDKFKMHKFALACVLDEIEVGPQTLFSICVMIRVLMIRQMFIILIGMGMI